MENKLGEFTDQFGAELIFFEDHLSYSKKKKSKDYYYNACEKIAIVIGSNALPHVLIEPQNRQKDDRCEFYYSDEDFQEIKRIVGFVNSKTNDSARMEEMKIFELSKQHVVTTCPGIEDHKIVEYHGIVSGCVALGAGILTGLSAGLADLGGQESKMLGDKMGRAKDTAIYRAIEDSIVKGGNAIVGLKIDYTALSNGMILVGATGTSVTIEKQNI